MEASFTSFTIIASVSGIAVGVMALIVVVSVMTGFELNLKSQMLEFKPHLIMKRSKGEILNHDDIIEQVSTIPSIDEIEAFISIQAVVSNEDIAIGTIIKGIQNYERNTSNSLTKKFVFLENNLSLTGSSIVLNTDLMHTLGLNLGEFIYIILPAGNLSPIGHIPRIKKFQIIGLINHNSFDLPGGYIAIDEAQKLLKLGEKVSGIEIRVVNPRNIKSVTNTILSRLGKLGDPIEIENWEEINSNLFSAMKLERIVMFFILSLIVLIATFSITASLAVYAHDKRKEIAILKSFGATNSVIYQIFIFQGILIGFLGTLIGTFSGIIVTNLIHRLPAYKFLSKICPSTMLPVSLEFSNITTIVLLALFMSFIAAMYPAYKVSRTERYRY